MEADSNIYFDIIPFAIKKDSEGKEIIQGAEHLGEQILKKIDYIRVYTNRKKASQINRFYYLVPARLGMWP